MFKNEFGIDKKEYEKITDAHSPKSPVLKNCLRAFSVGGLICVLAQGVNLLYSRLGWGRDDAGTLTAVTLILASALLTGLGLFDRIARFAGAGTLVPITGFANAVASQAIDAGSEGLVLGVGAKIFTVAGPVLLFGTLAGVLYGAVYYIVTLF